MKIQRFSSISVPISFVLSLVITFASYFYYTEPFTADARFLYRGWPLHWMVESWSLWGPPPYPHHFIFQPMNFLIDFIFWLVVFMCPFAMLFLFKGKNGKNGIREGAHTLSYFINLK